MSELSESANQQKFLGTVFISYSWDTESHVKAVLDLSNRLRSDGVDANLDQYEESPAEGWPKWMDRQVSNARYVLVVCTEIYYKRVMGEEITDKGLGAKWEGGLIYQHIYDAGTQNQRFIPVLLRAEDQKFIPIPLRGATHYRVDTEAGYERLYSRLLGKKLIEKPPLGKPRALPPKKVKTDISMFLSGPIDPPLWDDAKWRGTMLGTAEASPPVFGLAFLNEAPARKIFEQWHQRYGNSDDFEELRIAIIEGPIKGEGPGYSVHIGTDPDNTAKRYRAAGIDVGPDNLWAFISRVHRMNPAPQSTNLERFKSAYRHFKTYFLAPAIMEADGSNPRFLLELGIYKNSIAFRRSEDVGKHDIDRAVFRSELRDFTE